MRKLWLLWCRALGEKAEPDDDRYSDKVALFRTFIVLQAVICNAFIVANILISWLK